MDEPRATPAMQTRTMQIDYFNANAHESPKRWWTKRNHRAAAAAGVILISALIGNNFLGNFEQQLMMPPIWICSMWYVAERAMAGRGGLKMRLAMAVCAVLGAGIAPFVLVGYSGRWGVLSDLSNYGWHSRYVADYERVLFIFECLLLVTFTALELTDLLQRRRAK